MERARLSGVFDRAAPVYDTVEPRFFSEIASRLLTRLPLVAGMRVLDLATGPAVVLTEIARIGRARLRLTGVDLSSGMIQEAAARLSSAGILADLCVMDVHNLGFQDGSFDLVTMSRAYLLPQRSAVLCEIGRVLRPGGRLAIAEFGQLDPRWAWKEALYARMLPAGSRGAGRPPFAAASIRAELSEAGFAGVRVEGEHLDVVYDDLEHWWESSMSHGERAALELMDSNARRMFIELADAAACREEDGKLHWRPEILYAIAYQ